METRMEEEERAALEATLQRASLDVLKEIMREAELFLGDQFKAALAADSRAMTLSSILGALIALLTASSMTLTAAKFHIWPYEGGVVLLIACLALALRNSLKAAQPVMFGFGGNSPEHWAEDVENSYSLERSLAGMASLHAQDIRSNNVVLEDNQRFVLAAFGWIKAGIFLLIGTEVVVTCVMLGYGKLVI